MQNLNRLTVNFENSRWRTTAILEILTSLYISQNLFDFDDYISGKADWDFDKYYRIRKFKILQFKMAAGHHIGRNYFVHSSVAGICAKFCLKTQNLIRITVN